MATITVYSPVPGFSGLSVVEFVDGKAEVDGGDVDALSYFRRHGYGIGQPVNSDVPEPPDPRKLGDEGSGVVPLGTRLRDASVDPKPTDFLPPTNAGKANPHGPEVVSPGLHATPPAPIVPGPVSSVPAVQQEVETAAAADALGVTPEPAPEPAAKAKATRKPRGR